MYKKLYRLMVWVLLPMLLAGCATDGLSQQKVAYRKMPSPVLTSQPVALSPKTVDQLLHRPLAYHLGPGDVVSVSVYLHPALSATAGSGSVGIPGALVTNGGNIQLPMVGLVHVAGLTMAELRIKLEKLYSQYIIQPDVSVQLQVAHSIRYYLLGEFTAPGLKFSDRALTLLDAMALGGSVNFAEANLRSAYVVQDGKKLPINFHQLLNEGNLGENIELQSGDTVVVPSIASMRAFVFGAVDKPGPVPFVDGRLSLLQALSSAGMNTTALTNAQLRDIRVIRSEGTSGQLITVNANAILHGKAAPFYLKSGDVVFVPQTVVSSWNQVIQQILPSLQAVSGLLNPFVSIKYLSQPNN